MQTKSALQLLIALAWVPCCTRCLSTPPAGTSLRFTVLSAKTETAPPFAVLEFTYGPREKAGRWWQFEVRSQAETGAAQQCTVRALTEREPLAGRGPLRFIRYQLRLPDASEALEYVDVHTDQALLPAWVDWEKLFVPHPAPTSRRQGGLPETCEFLGHVLSLARVGHEGVWEAWPGVKRLVLDREMLVGTARNFKDVEGRRLAQTPKPQEYTYTNFTAGDYQTMIAAGVNLFTVAPEQQQYVQAEPVFYLRSAERAAGLRYPEDLYRANYFGAAMFVDEPASVMTWDRYLGTNVQYYSDAAALIEKRTRATFDSNRRYYGRYWLEQQLADSGVNLGDMRLAQAELPVWETFYDTAFYEMKGGGSGIVHEGRYRLAEFDAAMAQATGVTVAHTSREMLQWHYAWLRGGTAPFGKFWGTAIYGQCDPALAPEAFTTAYDMGARYFWFWTSDHGHHVPWPEQLALARALRQYAHAHPRPSLYGPLPRRDTLLTIPDGCLATLEEPPWVHVLVKERVNDASQKNQRLLRRVASTAHECCQRGEKFDIAIDDGRQFKGYRRVVKLSGKE